MAGLLDTIDQRTQMVGQNRLELLLFSLNGKQLYGINVFKVKEVLQCPPLTLMPGRNPVVRGVANIRGGTLSIIDLQMSMGMPELENIDQCFIIITEYNNSIQGFLVRSVERIVNTNWEDMHPPPGGSGDDNYLTAVTEVNDRLVEVLDVEKILAEVSPREDDISEGLIDEGAIEAADRESIKILVVDDSSVARKQMQRCIQHLGFEIILRNDGKQALDTLREMAAECDDITKVLPIVVSDIEMPEMDGYTLTTEIRTDPDLKDLYVMLHTSLSGVFNQSMVDKVGANDFLAKFNPDDLVTRVAKRISSVTGIPIVEDKPE
ncbi:MAG: chemotaxis protein CheV [Gammaproteobacteria bacterium]|nr:chemotaxis protein CheV [Gammaproteobacteria bacterium]